MPLKNRTNIILSTNPDYRVKDAVVVHSKEELLRELELSAALLFLPFILYKLISDIKICLFFAVGRDLPRLILIQIRKISVRLIHVIDLRHMSDRRKGCRVRRIPGRALHPF